VRTRVKVCGLTRVEDVKAAADAGADALGFVFVSASKRHVSIEQAEALFAAVPPFVETVALFMNPEPALVESVQARLAPSLLQFHGTESAAFCRRFGSRYIKAVPVAEGQAAMQAVMDEHQTAGGFLLDSHGAGRMGGSGESFDWALWPADTARPLILAGGLHPGNVGEAVRRLSPWAVDVSSGVEVSPGIKDPARIIRFINEVNHVQG